MAIWAEATQQLILADENADIDFVSTIIEGNTTIPVYICDEEGNVLASRNVNRGERREAKGERVGKHGPIELKIDDTTTQYIYWDDSRLLTSLRIVPYAQFALIFIFIAIAVVVMLTGQRSEQNRLWVGLSKETAHQLGTPISSLNAWQQLLADKYPKDEYVPQMKRDINRLQIIADRFQKIGSEPELQEQNLIPVIEEAIAYMRPRVSNRIDIDDNCLDGVERTVMLNAPLLQWVMENILKNAVDAISGKGTISLQASADDRSLMLSVQDSGSGIPAEEAEHIFERFVKLDSFKTGLGLGLPLCRIIANRLGGTIRLDSDYHQGARFVVTLPL